MDAMNTMASLDDCNQLRYASASLLLALQEESPFSMALTTQNDFSLTTAPLDHQDFVRVISPDAGKADKDQVKSIIDFLNDDVALKEFEEEFAAEDALMTVPIVVTQSTDHTMQNPDIDATQVEGVNFIADTASSEEDSSISSSIASKTAKKKRTRKQRDDDDEASANYPRFREFQSGLWNARFQELLDYKKKYHNCMVPHRYTPNPALARWVKRQRYQGRLKLNGKKSAMTSERAQALSEIGFVWDSQTECWSGRLQELVLFIQLHGHCCVPGNCPTFPRLATWIKCQRRQHTLFLQNKPTHITIDRIDALEAIGFNWEVRADNKK
ncbi:hypothetical protein MPSEU_001068000 [Mayamaea pseudoterrestris]|nr:hypothetical protein MPSEU_001068000 [Mayamaea pseudoterrestris]